MKMKDILDIVGVQEIDDDTLKLYSSLVRGGSGGCLRVFTKRESDDGVAHFLLSVDVKGEQAEVLRETLLKKKTGVTAAQLFVLLALRFLKREQDFFGTGNIAPDAIDRQTKEVH